MHLPKAVQGAFATYLRKRFPKAKGRVLEDSVAELSDLFTVRRAELPVSYLNRPPVRSAYLAYFHPLQVLRGVSALAEVLGRARRRGLLSAPEDRPLEVLDLGVGMGALSQALLILSAPRGGTKVPTVWPNFTFVDHQKSAAKDAKELTENVALALDPKAPLPQIRTVTASIEERLSQDRKHRPDVVLMGGVWNEWDGPWEPVLERLLRTVSPTGIVVIVEPAIPEVARRLMALRESFLHATTTIAPCTHGAACPLLALSRDWCFTTHTAQLPGAVRVLAEKLRHQISQVRYALWAFSPGAERAPFELPTTHHARAVTDAMQGLQVLCLDGETERRAVQHPVPLRGTLLTRK